MLNRITYPNGVCLYHSPLLTRAGVRHAFTTRIGGVSTGPYASLNLGQQEHAPESDRAVHIAANFRRVREAIGAQKLVRVEVKQVHGAEVWVPPADPIKPQQVPEADAIATDRPNALLCVRVADCVPVLLASDTGLVVAAVHAGWRGILAGVVPAACRTLRDHFDIRPSRLLAAVGPCISVEHFEVGPEVAQAFKSAGLDKTVEDRSPCRPHVDLRSAVRRELEGAGVEVDRVELADRCTYRDAQEFFSHRRDRGMTGRMAAVIAPRGR